MCLCVLLQGGGGVLDGLHSHIMSLVLPQAFADTVCPVVGHCHLGARTPTHIQTCAVCPQSAHVMVALLWSCVQMGCGVRMLQGKATPCWQRAIT